MNPLTDAEIGKFYEIKWDGGSCIIRVDNKIVEDKWGNYNYNDSFVLYNGRLIEDAGRSTENKWSKATPDQIHAWKKAAKIQMPQLLKIYDDTDDEFLMTNYT